MNQLRRVGGKYVVLYHTDEHRFSTEGTLKSLQENLEDLIKKYGEDTPYEFNAEYYIIGIDLEITRPATEEEITEFKTRRKTKRKV